MTRTGKIARLPIQIRSQLNRRLDDGEPAATLLPWLNAEPEVRRVLDMQFEGADITKQNLSEWHQGGFAEWQLRRELVSQAEEIDDQANNIGIVGDGTVPLVDKVATVLSAHYAALLGEWPAEADAKFEARLKLLNQMTRSVVQLQRSIHRAIAGNTQELVREAEEEEASLKQMRDDAEMRLLAPRTVRDEACIYGGGEAGYNMARALFCIRNNMTWEEFEERLNRGQSKPVQPSQGNAKRRGPKSKVQGPRSGKASSKLEVQGPKLEKEVPKSGEQRAEAEVQGPKSEVPGPNPEE